MSDFQGDLLLFSTDDGGEIDLNSDDLFVSDTGFDTMVYLCLEGGNELDNGSESTKNLEYWGNKLESDPDFKLTSRLYSFIKAVPLTPSNLNKARELAKEDLKPFINLGIVDTINITASIPERNKLILTIEGIKNKKKIFGTKYEKNWLSKLS